MPYLTPNPFPDRQGASVPVAGESPGLRFDTSRTISPLTGNTTSCPNGARISSPAWGESIILPPGPRGKRRFRSYPDVMYLDGTGQTISVTIHLLHSCHSSITNAHHSPTMVGVCLQKCIEAHTSGCGLKSTLRQSGPPCTATCHLGYDRPRAKPRCRCST